MSELSKFKDKCNEVIYQLLQTPLLLNVRSARWSISLCPEYKMKLDKEFRASCFQGMDFTVSLDTIQLTDGNTVNIHTYGNGVKNAEEIKLGRITFVKAFNERGNSIDIKNINLHREYANELCKPIN